MYDAVPRIFPSVVMEDVGSVVDLEDAPEHSRPAGARGRGGGLRLRFSPGEPGENRGARPPRAARVPGVIADEVLTGVGDLGGEGMDEIERVEDLLHEPGARIGWSAHTQAFSGARRP